MLAAAAAADAVAAAAVVVAVIAPKIVSCIRMGCCAYVLYDIVNTTPILTIVLYYSLRALGIVGLIKLQPNISTTTTTSTTTTAATTTTTTACRHSWIVSKYILV